MLLTAQVVRGSVGLGFVTLVVHPLAAPSEDRRRATFRRSDGQECPSYKGYGSVKCWPCTFLPPMGFPQDLGREQNQNP